MKQFDVWSQTDLRRKRGLSASAALFVQQRTALARRLQVESPSRASHWFSGSAVTNETPVSVIAQRARY
jgi:hypothetical protein